MENLKVDREELKKRLAELGISDIRKSYVLGEVYFMLSLRCNLRCRVCSWWGEKGACRNKNFFKRQSSRLDLKDLIKFASQIILFHPTTVTFSGGEPLLYPYWYPLGKYFKSKGIKVSLTTNGVYLKKEFKKIIEVVDEVNLSLGGSPSILPLIRENSISHFFKILEGLKKLTKFKEINNYPRLRVLYTISDLSYGHMNELIEFMLKNNIAIDQYYFQHLIFLKPEILLAQKKVFLQKFNIKKLNIWQGYTYCPSGINFKKLKQEIDKLIRYENVIFSPDLSFNEIKTYYKDNNPPSFYSRLCLAPWVQLNVLPNGDLYICNDYFIGNLKEKSFPEIWNGKKAQDLREYISKRLFPACGRCFYYYWERKK